MKNKNILLVTIFSIVACGLHAAILNTQFNYYVYSSSMKVIFFILCPVMYFVISKDGIDCFYGIAPLS